jgi:hypothetical protein
MMVDYLYLEYSISQDLSKMSFNAMARKARPFSTTEIKQWAPYNYLLIIQPNRVNIWR